MRILSLPDATGASSRALIAARVDGAKVVNFCGNSKVNFCGKPEGAKGRFEGKEGSQRHGGLDGGRRGWQRRPGGCIGRSRPLL